jgi:hypothetical protein
MMLSSLYCLLVYVGAVVLQALGGAAESLEFTVRRILSVLKRLESFETYPKLLILFYVTIGVWVVLNTHGMWGPHAQHPIRIYSLISG